MGDKDKENPGFALQGFQLAPHALPHVGIDRRQWLISHEDRNDDGALDNLDADFFQRTDGKWEADFTVGQQEFFADTQTAEGFKLWGWMDAPSFGTYSFKTCDNANGFTQQEYNTQFNGGRQFRDLLNHPSEYIEVGDYVSATSIQVDSLDQLPALEIDFLVEVL